MKNRTTTFNEEKTMSKINIYSEVLEQLGNKLNEEQMNTLESLYEDLENSIKFSKLDIMSIPNLEDFVFPTTIGEFKELLNNIKNYALQVKNKKVSDKIDAILQILPADEATATSTQYYNPLQEDYDSIPFHDNKVRMTNGSEPDISNIKKVVSDYILLNEINKSIEEEIDTVIKYFASRISDNEQGAKILFNRDYSYMESCVKLAAYLNLNSGCKINIEQPEISVKGNSALLEISLYNGFLASIFKIIKYWKNTIFNYYNAIPGDNLPTDVQKRIDKIVKSPVQYDSVYKVINICVCEIIKDKLTKFVNSMKEYQDSIKEVPNVELNEPEAIALEELFFTKLGKHAPAKYLKQWV